MYDTERAIIKVISVLLAVFVLLVLATGCGGWTLSYRGNDNPKVEYGGRIGDDSWFRVTNGLNKPVDVFLECPEEALVSMPPKSEFRFIYNNLDKLATEHVCRLIYWISK